MMHTYQKSAIVGQILTDLHKGIFPIAVDIVNRENDVSISAEDYVEQVQYAQDRINSYMADVIALQP